MPPAEGAYLVVGAQGVAFDGRVWKSRGYEKDAHVAGMKLLVTNRYLAREVRPAKMGTRSQWVSRVYNMINYATRVGYYPMG